MQCQQCGGAATPGLAHLHGNPLVPLCYPCTREQLEKPKAQKPKDDEEDLAA
jgi:hypothetical protein